MEKVLIIGGGISGLTVAYWLHKSGVDVTVLEKEARPGGSIRTEKEKGYLIECGPNSTLDLYREVDDLCEGLGIMGEKIFAESAAGNRYVLRDGRLRPLPVGPLQFLTTDLWSLRGKLRLLREPFIPGYRGPAEETVAQFVIRRTGQEFLDYAIDPFVTGVFAGDPYRLSLKSSFPKMYTLEQEYGSLVKGALFGRKNKREPKRKMRLFSFKEGLETMPAAIADVLGDRLKSGFNVTMVKRNTTILPSPTLIGKMREGQAFPFDSAQVIPGRSRRGGDGFEVIAEKDGKAETFHADSVVLATPAWGTAKIIHPLSERIAEALMAIAYIPVAIVFTGFDRRSIKHPLDGFGFLIPSKESKRGGYSLLGSIWSSAIFPGRAPEGKAAFTNILGGARNRDILEYSDKELIEMTLRDLRNILAIEEKPDFLRIVRQPRAIPQYTPGHGDRIAAIEKGLQEIPGLYLAGNYINGVSVGHCIAEATKLAAKICTNAQIRLKPNPH